MAGFGAVPEALARQDSVSVAAPRLGHLEVAGFAQFGHDFTHSSLGDANLGCEFGELDLWILANLHDYVTVVAQKCPIHGTSIAELE